MDEKEKTTGTDSREEDIGPKNAKERLYDKIPMTYRQADILVKIMVAVLVVVLVIGIATGNR